MQVGRLGLAAARGVYVHVRVGQAPCVRDAGEAGVQVIQAEICGLDPEWGVWEQCQWDPMGNVTPHPACACGC